MDLWADYEVLEVCIFLIAVVIIRVVEYYYQPHYIKEAYDTQVATA